MVFFFSERLIRNIRIVGGTHGHERLGVFMVNNRDSFNLAPYDTLNVEFIMANEIATKKSVRCVDYDLNDYDPKSAEPKNPEVARRQALQTEMGHTDFVIDLHSTTAAMGTYLILNSQNDVVAQRLASDLLKERPLLKVSLCGFGVDCFLLCCVSLCPFTTITDCLLVAFSFFSLSLCHHPAPHTRS